MDETQAASLNGRLLAAALHGRVEELRALVELGADYNVGSLQREALRCIGLLPEGIWRQCGRWWSSGSNTT